MQRARVWIVKNELGRSATQQELRGWEFGGHNGMNGGTEGLNPRQPPLPSIRTLQQAAAHTACLVILLILPIGRIVRLGSVGALLRQLTLLRKVDLVINRQRPTDNFVISSVFCRQSRLLAFHSISTFSSSGHNWCDREDLETSDWGINGKIQLMLNKHDDEYAFR